VNSRAGEQCESSQDCVGHGDKTECENTLTCQCIKP
jgi:hypothetical protein